MKIYLAGNGAMPKSQRPEIYQFLERRLISFFEIQPGRFCHMQWKWLKNENILSGNSTRK